MVKRIALLLLAILLALPAGGSLAELKLRDKTPAQKMLKTYMENVNAFLEESGELPINKIFDQANSIVEMGITVTEETYIPEGVTVTVHLYYDQLWYMLVRVDSNNMQRFPRIAAAFIRALNPKTMTQADAIKVPTQRLQKALNDPNTSFEDFEYNIYEDRETSILNGERPQTYYSYYPNQYKEDPRVDWIELMVIFPIAEYWDIEKGSFANDERNSFTHIEYFATPTPEPDSAAGEDGWAGP